MFKFQVDLFFELSCTQTHGQTETQTGRQTARQMHRHTDGHMYSIVVVDKTNHNYSLFNIQNSSSEIPFSLYRLHIFYKDDPCIYPVLKLHIYLDV